MSDGDASLVITAYTLPGIFLAPLVGPLADQSGRRRVLVGSLCCFGAAGAAVGGRVGYRPVLLVAALSALAAVLAWVRLTR